MMNDLMVENGSTSSIKKIHSPRAAASNKSASTAPPAAFKDFSRNNNQKQ